LTWSHPTKYHWFHFGNHCLESGLVFAEGNCWALYDRTFRAELWYTVDKVFRELLQFKFVFDQDSILD